MRRIRSYSRVYELFCAPLVILWKQKPLRQATADGKLHVSYWKTAFKIFADPQFLNKIREFKLEAISQSTFEEIDKFIRNEKFNEDEADRINQCLGCLVRWSKGVYMFHQYLREYSLSQIDHLILTQTEKQFAEIMDKLCYRNFRMLRYVQEHCQAELSDIQDLVDHFKMKNAA